MSTQTAFSPRELGLIGRCILDNTLDRLSAAQPVFNSISSDIDFIPHRVIESESQFSNASDRGTFSLIDPSMRYLIAQVIQPYTSLTELS